MESIRGYGFAGLKHRRRIGIAAALSDRFLNAVAAALDASERLSKAAEVTGAQLRDAINFTNAYRPFADNVELMSRGARQAVENARAEAGAQALKAYKIGRGMNSPGDRELLVPHLANIKEALGRGRPKTQAAQPTTAPPTPTPTPAVSPTAPPKEGGGRA
ncbi:MAG: hypothetical protein DMF56_21795 [Acidobacteria bacterium]|nr:MAG: hypothetical protein DMF56_21795 [Acidobacteriota bacterium]